MTDIAFYKLVSDKFISIESDIKSSAQMIWNFLRVALTDIQLLATPGSIFHLVSLLFHVQQAVRLPFYNGFTRMVFMKEKINVFVEKTTEKFISF